MTSRLPMQATPPKFVRDKYMEIMSSDLMVNKTLNDSTILGFQQSLNDSQPQTDDESKMRSFIQFMYRKNPVNFCRYLEKSRLNHLILWTESRGIVNHFGLHGVVYVKWVDDHYECSLHKNMLNNGQVAEHPSVQQMVNNVHHRSQTDQGRSRRGRVRDGGGNRRTQRPTPSPNEFPDLSKPTLTHAPPPSPTQSTSDTSDGESVANTLTQSICQ